MGTERGISGPCWHMDLRAGLRGKAEGHFQAHPRTRTPGHQESLTTGSYLARHLTILASGLLALRASS